MSTSTYIKILLPKSLFAFVFFILMGANVIAQQASTYDEAIIYAKKKLEASQLKDAKAYFQQALKIKPGDEYSKQQINIIVDKMKMAMAVEDEYYDFIDLGDELYDQNKLSLAIDQYKNALAIVPNDEYSLKKIGEIEKFQNSEKDKIDSFDKTMEAGKVYITDGEFDKAIAEFTEAAGIFPDKESPLTELNKAKQLKDEFDEKVNLYNVKCEEAERYFLVKKFAESLKLYQEAVTIMPEDDMAKNKVTILIPMAAKELKFNQIIEKADNYYIDQDFISAQKEYTTASELWPEKSYPGDMIAKINEKLDGEKEDLEENYNLYILGGDSLLTNEEYALALGKYNLALNLKPGESYPKSKISEIEAVFENQQKAFEDNYNLIIASADSAYESGAYIIARGKYEDALVIKSDDTYPTTQIAEIDKIADQLAAEAKSNQEYNSAIKQADNLFDTGNYEMATEKYTEAKELKPTETYPQTKIDAIVVILANVEKQKLIDDEYNALILTANQQLDRELLVEARDSYVKASEIKPAATLPSIQINTIDSLVIVKQKEAQIKKQFNELLAEGDSHTDAKEYDLAIEKYDAALVLIPDENIAVSKKQSIITIKENIRKKAELQKKYNDAIAKGDDLFNQGSFELSKVEFEKAKSLKSSEEYPKQKLTEIAKELLRLEAEKEQRFTEAIANADMYYDQGLYNDALKKYQLAKSIKPAESHPQQRITECEKYIAERNALLMEDYKIAVAEADKLHQAKVYDKAILAYRKAGNKKPDEIYPSEMIDQITKFIEENSIVDVIKSADTITKGSTGKFAFEPIKINVRKSNYIYIKARNISEKNAKLIFSYGSDGSKNGGFVVQVIEGDEYNDYIVRVGNQYKWFSEDNNWLTIYPENGDVEISMLRISKGY